MLLPNALVNRFFSRAMIFLKPTSMQRIGVPDRLPHLSLKRLRAGPVRSVKFPIPYCGMPGLSRRIEPGPPRSSHRAGAAGRTRDRGRSGSLPGGGCSLACECIGPEPLFYLSAHPCGKTASSVRSAKVGEDFFFGLWMFRCRQAGEWLRSESL